MSILTDTEIRQVYHDAILTQKSLHKKPENFTKVMTRKQLIELCDKVISLCSVIDLLQQ